MISAAAVTTREAWRKPSRTASRASAPWANSSWPAGRGHGDQRELLAGDDLRGRDRGHVRQRLQRRDGRFGGSLRVAAAGDVGDDRQLAVDADTEAVGDEVVRLA